MKRLRVPLTCSCCCLLSLTAASFFWWWWWWWWWWWCVCVCVCVCVRERERERERQMWRISVETNWDKNKFLTRWMKRLCIRASPLGGGGGGGGGGYGVCVVSPSSLPLDVLWTALRAIKNWSCRTNHYYNSDKYHYYSLSVLFVEAEYLMNVTLSKRLCVLVLRLYTYVFFFSFS